MEPISAIGLIASIAQLLDGTIKFVEYVNNVKKAPESRMLLALEATTLLGLLTGLKYRVERAETRGEPWYIGAQTLGGKYGPLEQLAEQMNVLTAKIQPKRGGSLIWPFTETSVKAILRRIESLKSHIALTLQDDQLSVKRTLSLLCKI